MTINDKIYDIIYDTVYCSEDEVGGKNAATEKPGCTRT